MIKISMEIKSECRVRPIKNNIIIATLQSLVVTEGLTPYFGVA